MPRLKLRNLTVSPEARVLRTEPADAPGRRRARLSVTGMICSV